MTVRQMLQPGAPVSPIAPSALPWEAVAAGGAPFNLLSYVTSLGQTLLFWYEPLVANITFNSGNVVSITDASGNANSIGEAAANAQPGWSAAYAPMNNRPAVIHDGSDDKLTRTTLTQGEITQPSTIVITAEPHDTGAGLGSGQLMIDGAAAGTRHVIDLAASGANAVSDVFAGSAAVASSPAFTSTGVHVFVGVFNGASSRISVDGTRSSATGSAGTHSLGGITVGNRYTGSFYFDGAWGEIIGISGALTAGQLAPIIAWQAAKFGATIV